MEAMGTGFPSEVEEMRGPPGRNMPALAIRPLRRNEPLHYVSMAYNTTLQKGRHFSTSGFLGLRATIGLVVVIGVFRSINSSVPEAEKRMEDGCPFIFSPDSVVLSLLTS
ncbi:unnamed protein product [Caenorhabditis auriculariae]|uniref:Uncharacterized protein n=1 Tax=Caenorhabditis auriculariae TaxID=2777116 RepID=A0A8S1H2V9_9PELO|nr:unnamed protein product [Caenorhabditis auriculariae]